MFWHFLKNPLKVGALCASSEKLAQAMIEEIHIKETKSIAEIGPGTGVFTKEILKHKSKDSKFFAIEISPTLTHRLQKKFPQIRIYNQSAEKILQIMKEEGVEELDAIISGLPWSIFSNREQNLLLQEFQVALKDNGVFSTFAYILPTPKARAFKKKLSFYFRQIKVSKIIWKNFPPAYVYYCYK